MANLIRLEFNTLQILKNREKWQIYFLIATEDPTNDESMVYTTLPSKSPIALTKRSDNIVQFKPEGDNTEGLFVFQRDMPSSGSINVDVYLMQSRQKMRNTGGVLDTVNEEANQKGLAGTVVKTLGKATPWTAVGTVAGKGLGTISNIMSGMKDKQLGFISMSEDFSGMPEGTSTRKNRFASGFAELEWAWNLS